jgi:hypothetical protein
MLAPARAILKGMACPQTQSPMQLRRGLPEGNSGRRQAPSSATTYRESERNMLQGFKNFLLRGDVIVVAVGLVIALAFSALITSFTANVINPIIQSLTGGKVGLGFQIRSGNPKTVVDLGAFITAIRAIHVSGAASVTERHRTWSLVQLGQIGPSQSNPLSWATPVK